MRVCVLTDEDPEEFDPGPFMQFHDWEMITMKAPAKDVIETVSAESPFDVYLNICEGAEDDVYTGAEVIQTLEELNLPFTGADSQFYNPTREAMQNAAEEWGLPFAKGTNVKDPDAVAELVSGLAYPLMVKHPNGFGSTGITRDSRVSSSEELIQQVKRVASEFGSARVEEFIEGPEFTVLVVDDPNDYERPFVYPPAELIFPEGEHFMHEDVKWVEWVYLKPVRDLGLTNRLQQICRDFYLALDGVGYARCDVRMKPNGDLYLLEINPNCGIFYEPEMLGPADTVMDYDPGGHAGFFDRIFRSAIARQKLREAERGFVSDE